MMPKVLGLLTHSYTSDQSNDSTVYPSIYYLFHRWDWGKAASLPKFLQEPGMNKAEVWSQEPNAGLPPGNAITCTFTIASHDLYQQETGVRS